MKLEGKIALVTGAGNGIGQAIATLFAREGADIAVNDIDLPSAEATAARIRRLGRKALSVIADVSNAGQVGEMISKVINEMDGIHILINNAGVPEYGTMIEEQTAERWDRAVAVNLRGTYLCSRRVGQWMASHGGGKIVNISATDGLSGSPFAPGYGATKAGVINLTRSLAVDWGQYKINVNCIAPGVIDTPFMRQTISTSSDLEKVTQRIPLARIGEVEDVAHAALFLVSEEANYITGVTLPVDGGWLA
jgi:NAD(P)-dependent dehydrogenase (short-subunit alcohol dehydrogenase family)